ncbi:MAG: YgiQ family radical SAM protein [Candidatus Nitricoxidivorans perseverans]|uniref:YgiQ family radical SAM protein n=1 Tax=Candidatus Nitricoxidivorans perseverans TaxID=2975601 RepID=A0AA49FN90_9PROT|nr:MAG: YgiQ family radical SAM protein [Candidatus Nitricoxidivorans perseverans]
MTPPAPPARSLTSWKPHWAKRFGVAPFLPMSRAEMESLGWDACDVILVTGDAYVDHPSFGMALIGRLLEAQGFRVGIVAQPDWHSAEAFRALGRPNLFFGITAGNMDSMVNRYTSERKIRSDDAYTPDGAPDRRPDRAVLVYAQRAREAYGDVPLVVGGIEASLRRIAHYDYWSDKVRRSILPDSKADLLLFGNAERAIVDLAHRLAKGERIEDIRDLRGTAFMAPRGWMPGDDWQEVGDTPVKAEREKSFIRLPAFEEVSKNPVRYAAASRAFHLESNPGNARALVQAHGDRDLWLNPPPIPLSTAEMDHVYGLPYARAPHPSYGEAKIPAWEMIRFSVNIMRGCFGGCTFCSITEHEGRIVQNRSEASILREIEDIRDKTPGFTGVISDLGGPTANMYRMRCKDAAIESACRRLSCVYPEICPNMNTGHAPLIHLYRAARALPGVKKILIGSGLRYDLAVRSPEYVKELVAHHVGGYLKIAPEHTEEGPLSKMMKPGMGSYDRFKAMFEKATKEAGKEQYLIPYFIAAHPGTTDEDMLELALWLKRNDFRLDQVQTFLPTPLALASAMYHTGKNPLKRVSKNAEEVDVVKGERQRRLHKAFLRYHDPKNWPMLRDALKQMGRADLIGSGRRHLVPAWQPSPPPGAADCRRRDPGGRIRASGEVPKRS